MYKTNNNISPRTIEKANETTTHGVPNLGHGSEQAHPFCGAEEINGISTIPCDNWIFTNTTDIDKEYKYMYRFASTQQHH